jgi:GTP-binding protein
MDRAVVAAEFYELGCGDPCVISSAHGEGVRELVELALARFRMRAKRMPTSVVRGSPSPGGPTSARARW